MFLTDCKAESDREQLEDDSVHLDREEYVHNFFAFEERLSAKFRPLV